MIGDTILQIFGMLIIALIIYVAAGVLLPKKIKDRERTIYLITIIGICIAAGYYIGKAQNFSVEDVRRHYSFPEVMAEYRKNWDDDIRPEVADYLKDRVDFYDVMGWYGISRKEIASEYISEHPGIVEDYLENFPEIALEFASNWNS